MNHKYSNNPYAKEIEAWNKAERCFKVAATCMAIAATLQALLFAFALICQMNATEATEPNQPTATQNTEADQ